MTRGKQKKRYTIEYDPDQGYSVVDHKMLVTLFRSQYWTEIETWFNKNVKNEMYEVK